MSRKEKAAIKIQADPANPSKMVMIEETAATVPLVIGERSIPSAVKLGLRINFGLATKTLTAEGIAPFSGVRQALADLIFCLKDIVKQSTPTSLIILEHFPQLLRSFTP